MPTAAMINMILKVVGDEAPLYAVRLFFGSGFEWTSSGNVFNPNRARTRTTVAQEERKALPSR